MCTGDLSMHAPNTMHLMFGWVYGVHRHQASIVAIIILKVLMSQQAAQQVGIPQGGLPCSLES